MSYLYKILTIAVLLASLSASGQLQSEYTLDSDQITVFETSKTLSSKLIKTGDTLNWEQQEASSTNTISYAITGITGHWDAGTSLGELSYTLNKEGFTAVSFTLSGTENNGLQATLSIQEGDQPALVYTFNITNITYP